MLQIFKYDFFAPHYLWFLLVVPFLFIYLWVKENRRAGDWNYTGLSSDQKQYNTFFIPFLRKSFILINCLVLSCLLLALAKPYNWHAPHSHHLKEGIDIVLAIDISGSMQETDFYPSRIEVAKKVAKEFVDGRKTDRIGLVAYAGQAFTACPTTTDYNMLKQQIDALHCEMNIEGGTAIGLGLGTAVTRLRSDSIASKVIILITDGSNNMGNVSPLEAADWAREKKIKVYTIGMGNPSDHESDLDEQTLKEIARITKGKYFRASNERGLRIIYDEIEAMEKRSIIDRYFQHEPPSDPTSILYIALFLMFITWSCPYFLFFNHD